jgi:predicted N-acetyltransferase YhbS
LDGRVEIVEFGRLLPAQRAELEGDEKDPFDSMGSDWHFRAKDRHVALSDNGGRLVASTGMVIVEVEVDPQRFSVVGIGGVIVNAAHRGRGLAREVVEAALARAKTLGPRFALLFCHEDRAGLYRRLGFAELDVPVRVQQPDGLALMPQHTMWRALHQDASWPPGPAVVHSLPF